MNLELILLPIAVIFFLQRSASDGYYCAEQQGVHVDLRESFLCSPELEERQQKIKLENGNVGPG